MQLSQIWGCPPWTCCVTTGTAGVIMTSGWSPCFGTPAAAVGAVGGKVSAAAAFGAATIGAAGSRDPIAEGIHVSTQNSLCVNSFFFRLNMPFVKFRCPPWTCCVTTGTAGVIMTLGWSSSFGVASAATGAVGDKVSAAAAFGAATIGAAGSRDPIAEGIHVKTQNSLCVNSFFRTKLTF